jgi:hypothetical protein
MLQGNVFNFKNGFDQRARMLIKRALVTAKTRLHHTGGKELSVRVKIKTLFFFVTNAPEKSSSPDFK